MNGLAAMETFQPEHPAPVTRYVSEPAAVWSSKEAANAQVRELLTMEAEAVWVGSVALAV